MFVLDTAPQALDEDVIEHPSPTIHADPDVMALQLVGELAGGELHALIGVEDFGLSLLQGQAQDVQTKQTIERVGQLLGQHKPTVPIQDRHQIHEASAQRHVGDVADQT